MSDIDALKEFLLSIERAIADDCALLFEIIQDGDFSIDVLLEARQWPRDSYGVLQEVICICILLRLRESDCIPPEYLNVHRFRCLAACYTYYSFSYIFPTAWPHQKAGESILGWLAALRREGRLGPGMEFLPGERDPDQEADDADTWLRAEGHWLGEALTRQLQDDPLGTLLKILREFPLPDHLESAQIYVMQPTPFSGAVGRLNGPAPGIAPGAWPHEDGKPMRHVLTLDLDELPAKYRPDQFPNARSLSVFGSKDFPNDQNFEPYAKNTHLIYASPDDIRRYEPQDPFRELYSDEEGVYFTETLRFHFIALEIPRVVLQCIPPENGLELFGKYTPDTIQRIKFLADCLLTPPCIVADPPIVFFALNSFNEDTIEERAAWEDLITIIVDHQAIFPFNGELFVFKDTIRRFCNT